MKISCLYLIFSFATILFTVKSAAAQVDDKMIPNTADQVHFTIINNTSVTFDWVGTTNKIMFGSTPAKLNHIVSGKRADFLPVISPWTSDPGPYWEAKLTGLQQNTSYFYSIGENGEVHQFRTPPPPGAGGFRVCLTSDMHESSKECVAMFKQIAGLKPDLVLTTGDITGAGPDGQQEVSKRFHDAMAWSQSAAWMPAWGNHDWEYTGKDDLRTLKGRFDIPNPGTISSSPAVSCCGEDWGWFDYGNVRFISYPEPWTSSSWKEWISQVTKVFISAQNDPSIKFIVTFGHRSAYTSTSRRSPGDTHLSALLDGLNASYSKYKLDLSGHNHQYERYRMPTGMNYIVNSSTGSYYHEGWDNSTKPANCQFRAIHYGILVLDFTETSMEGRFVCSVGTTQTGADYLPLEEHLCNEPGAVIDSFTITNF
jgi:hypothetical protein